MPETGITGYAPTLEKEIFEFARIAWPDRPRSLIESRWRWMFVESAERRDVEPRVWLYRDAGTVVAHHGAMRVQLKVGTEVFDSAWFADTMVLEHHRGTATGARLVMESNETFPVGLSLGQTERMRKIALQVGWRQVAPLQTYVLLLRPRHVFRDKLNPLVASVADLGLSARHYFKRRLSGGRADSLDVRILDRFEARHDRLWDSVKTEYPCAVTRDASYLNWKYVTQPGQDFLRLEFLRQGQVAAVAVLSLDDPGPVYRYRRAFIVDLVVSPSDSTLVASVMDAIRRCCAASRVDAIVVHLINEMLEQHLRVYGFIRRQPTRFLLVSALHVSADARRQLLSPAGWLITMGDSDIDRPWEADGHRIQMRTGAFTQTRLPGAQLDASAV